MKGGRGRAVAAGPAQGPRRRPARRAAPRRAWCTAPWHAAPSPSPPSGSEQCPRRPAHSQPPHIQLPRSNEHRAITSTFTRYNARSSALQSHTACASGNSALYFNKYSNSLSRLHWADLHHSPERATHQLLLTPTPCQLPARSGKTTGSSTM